MRKSFQGFLRIAFKPPFYSGIKNTCHFRYICCPGMQLSMINFPVLYLHLEIGSNNMYTSFHEFDRGWRCIYSFFCEGQLVHTAEKSQNPKMSRNIVNYWWPITEIAVFTSLKNNSNSGYTGYNLLQPFRHFQQV